MHIDLFERIATIRNGMALGDQFLIATNFAGVETAVLKAHPLRIDNPLLTADIRRELIHIEPDSLMNIQLLAFIQNLLAPELILIFLVVLLLFGAKRLPELFKSFGKSIKEFKKATADIENDVRNAMDAEDEPKAAPRAESKSVAANTPAAEAPKSDESEVKKDDA